LWATLPHSTDQVSLCLFLSFGGASGHRLLAVALAPINDQTLVSGTGDGGQTVRNSDSHLDALLQVSSVSSRTAARVIST
jgi:hypothetical protein